MEGASVLNPAEGPEKEAPKRLGVAGIAAIAVVVFECRQVVMIQTPKGMLIVVWICDMRWWCVHFLVVVAK